MSESHQPPSSDPVLPRRALWKGQHAIPAPSHDSFTTRFGHAFPKPTYLHSDLGSTAVYSLSAPSGTSLRAVLIIHGANTPALGMLPLAKHLQALDPNAHIVLFDLWGHGLSSTPVAPHTPATFHFQILQVLGYMRWTCAHILGYSLGGITAISFAVENPWMVLSAAIMGPAGLLSLTDFPDEMRGLLDGSRGTEADAADAVLSWLEGGPLAVPADWKEKMQAGEVVAQALREWELQEHAGYRWSVLSLFRDAGVRDQHEMVVNFAKLPLKKIGIVGERDPVCSKARLRDLGFELVEVVKDADHSFVRAKAGEVARIVHNFWTQQ